MAIRADAGTIDVDQLLAEADALAADDRPLDALDVLSVAAPVEHPTVDRRLAEVIRERMSDREGHFMPTSLLQSQIDTLEPLEPDESGLVLDLRRTPEELIAASVAWLRERA